MKVSGIFFALIIIFTALVCTVNCFFSCEIVRRSSSQLRRIPFSQLEKSSQRRLYAKRKTTIRRKSQPIIEDALLDDSSSEGDSSSVDLRKVEALSSNIQEDIDEFSKPRFMQEQEQLFKREEAWKASREKSSLRDIFKPVKDAVSFILIADFFVVLLFLAWFLVAVALKGTAPVVLEKLVFSLIPHCHNYLTLSFV